MLGVLGVFSRGNGCFVTGKGAVFGLLGMQGVRENMRSQGVCVTIERA